MTPLTKLLPLSLALLSIAPRGSETKLEFAPEEGSRWVKTFTQTSSLEGAELSVVMDGEEVPSEFLPELELTIENESEVRITDTYVAMGDGRPTELARSFESIREEIASAIDMGGFEGTEPQEGEVRGSSELQGETVVFTWDEDAQAYEAAFEDEDTDVALLDGLVEDTDLRGILPEDAVDVGDEWTVDAEAVAAVLGWPGGELGVEYEGDDTETYNVEVLGTSYDGELTLTLEGTHDQDRTRVASIRIEGQVQVRVGRAGNLDRVPVVDGAATETTILDLEIEGELVWNLDAGYLSSLELEADAVVEILLVKNPGEPGPAFESSVVLEGESSFAVKAEPAE